MARAIGRHREKVDPALPTASEVAFFFEMRHLLGGTIRGKDKRAEITRASWRKLSRDEKLDLLEYERKRDKRLRREHKERVLLRLQDPSNETEHGWLRADRARRERRARLMEANGPRPTDRKTVDEEIQRILAGLDTTRTADQQERHDRRKAKKAAKRRARFERIVDAEEVLLDPAEVPVEVVEPVVVDTPTFDDDDEPVDLEEVESSHPRPPRRRSGISGVSIPYDD